MEKDKEKMLIPPATLEQVAQANEIVNGMAEAGIIIAEEGAEGERLLEVTLKGGVKVINELDQNNKLKNNSVVKI